MKKVKTIFICEDCYPIEWSTKLPKWYFHTRTLDLMGISIRMLPLDGKGKCGLCGNVVYNNTYNYA